jgi:putative transposase
MNGGMGRPLRAVADGLVYHALNRGNNRERVFHAPADFAAFLKALRQTKQRYPFRFYGYCLMSNHFHLLLQPEDGQSISRILQSLTVAHTWHYHRRHGTVGHVWQGRFKSPVIQDDDHLLTVLRYIEGNALRAGLVPDLKDYPWSSYPTHGLGRIDDLLSALPGWANLARTEEARQALWRQLVHQPLSQRELTAVRRAVTSGRPFGTPVWAETMAKALGIPLSARPRGRPRKQPVK